MASGWHDSGDAREWGQQGRRFQRPASTIGNCLHGRAAHRHAVHAGAALRGRVRCMLLAPMWQAPTRVALMQLAGACDWITCSNSADHVELLSRTHIQVIG